MHYFNKFKRIFFRFNKTFHHVNYRFVLLRRTLREYSLKFNFPNKAIAMLLKRIKNVTI